MANNVADAGELIRDRLRAIDDERKRLEQALKHLAPTGRSRSTTRTTRQASGRGAGQPRATARSRSRRKVAPAGERRRQLIAHLETHPGAKPAEIAKAIETSRANVHNVLRKALADGAVSKGDNGAYAVSQPKAAPKERARKEVAK